MSKKELEGFMAIHGLSVITLAELLGVTRQAIYLWMGSKKGVTPTASKVIRFLANNPKLIKEFNETIP